MGELPQGYDHKYVYSHFGYNLKVTDFIMNNAFWVEVYPGMTDEKIDYMAQVICEAAIRA